MNMKITQTLGLQMRLTPQLIVLMRLMALPSFELRQEVAKALEENPLLEEDSSAESTETLPLDDTKLLEYLSDGPAGPVRGAAELEANEEQRRPELAVKSYEVVRSQEAAYGRTAVETAMVAMPVVVVQPTDHSGAAHGRGRVGATIGPLPQERLDEALGLAIGARRVRPGARVPEPRALAGRRKDVGAVARAVVCHEPPDTDAMAPKPGEGAPEKAHARDPVLIGQDLDVGQAGGIIDGHVHELPADAPHAAAAVARDAVPNAADPPEFLDVNVHESSRSTVLVPYDGRRRRQVAHARQTQPPQISGDGGRAEIQSASDLGARPVLPTQPLDELAQFGRRPPGAVVRPTGPIGQGLRRPGPRDPLADRPRTDPEGRGDLSGGLVLGDDAANNLGSTLGRGPGILVDVHPSLLLVWGELGSPTTSYPLVARMNNLLTLHI